MNQKSKKITIKIKIKLNSNPKGISLKIHKVLNRYHLNLQEEAKNKYHLLKSNLLLSLSSNFMPNNFTSLESKPLSNEFNISPTESITKNLFISSNNTKSFLNKQKTRKNFINSTLNPVAKPGISHIKDLLLCYKNSLKL